ncbi:hypothetical protein DH2020_011438 [Rehmannia glutinosa]|uniref:Late embryogenesis abundant protein LEA-2 subgroup domain-containing protein n=1 Tax=Rehmannia glutinosa TaxID=99300 RepID=A0ABR0XDM3_REHGL
MLNGNRPPPPPPYGHRNIPRYNSSYKKKSGGNTCFRCICCCYCCLFLLIVILAALAFYFYTIDHPKIPSYKVENLEVKAFDLMPDFSLKTDFLVTVRADNPNNNIGFIYGDGSSVDVFYNDSDLCSGKLPFFHQGHKNTTFMKIDLTGKSEFGSGLQEALSESRKNGKIPLLVRVRVPISVVVGEFPLRQFKVFVNCSLVVDNLAPGKKIGILSSNTTFDFEF